MKQSDDMGWKRMDECIAFIFIPISTIICIICIICYRNRTTRITTSPTKIILIWEFAIQHVSSKEERNPIGLLAAQVTAEEIEGRNEWPLVLHSFFVQDTRRSFRACFMWCVHRWISLSKLDPFNFVRLLSLRGVIDCSSASCLCLLLAIVP